MKIRRKNKEMKIDKTLDTVERERERELQFIQHGYRNQYQKN